MVYLAKQLIRFGGYQRGKKEYVIGIFIWRLPSSPCYGILLIAYYTDFINGFVFSGALVGVLVIASILLIIFRKNKFRVMVIIFVFLLSFLLWGFEIRLLEY